MMWLNMSSVLYCFMQCMGLALYVNIPVLLIGSVNDIISQWYFSVLLSFLESTYMSVMCFVTEQTNTNLHYPLIMRIICSAMPIVYVLLVISARDVVSVSWWSDLSFLNPSDLKKYLKLCTNVICLSKADGNSDCVCNKLATWSLSYCSFQQGLLAWAQHCSYTRSHSFCIRADDLQRHKQQK